MAQKHHSHQFTRTEEAITVLFCLIDDLRQPQPKRAVLRVPQAALRFRDHNPRSVPATAGHRVRALLPTRRREVLLAPLPRRGRPCPFLLPSPLAQAKVLLGTLEMRDRGRACGRPRDPARRLDPAYGYAS